MHCPIQCNTIQCSAQYYARAVHRTLDRGWRCIGQWRQWLEMHWRVQQAVVGCITRSHQQASPQRAPSPPLCVAQVIGRQQLPLKFGCRHSRHKSSNPTRFLLTKSHQLKEASQSVGSTPRLTPELLSPPIWVLHQTKWGHITPFTPLNLHQFGGNTTPKRGCKGRHAAIRPPYQW